VDAHPHHHLVGGGPGDVRPHGGGHGQGTFRPHSGIVRAAHHLLHHGGAVSDQPRQHHLGVRRYCRRHGDLRGFEVRVRAHRGGARVAAHRQGLVPHRGTGVPRGLRHLSGLSPGRAFRRRPVAPGRQGLGHADVQGRRRVRGHDDRPGRHDYRPLDAVLPTGRRGGKGHHRRQVRLHAARRGGGLHLRGGGGAFYRGGLRGEHLPTRPARGHGGRRGPRPQAPGRRIRLRPLRRGAHQRLALRGRGAAPFHGLLHLRGHGLGTRHRQELPQGAGVLLAFYHQRGGRGADHPVAQHSASGRDVRLPGDKRRGPAVRAYSHAAVDQQQAADGNLRQRPGL